MEQILKHKKGFTLIELLVVISIIGILSSISVVSVNTARRKARDVKRQADISTIQLGLYLYYDDQRGFPEADNGDPAVNWATLTAALDGSTGYPIYMGRVPFDPTNKDPYVYDYISDGISYTLSYELEDGGPRTLSGE